MTPIVFGGVSTASLGSMLAGFGVIALFGELWPETLFWWDESGAVVASWREEPDEPWNRAAVSLCDWAKQVGTALEKTRQKSKKRADGTSEILQKGGVPPLADAARWDLLGEDLIAFAAGAGVAFGRVLRPSPLTGRWGQDGSANYFASLKDAAYAVEKATGDDLRRTLDGSSEGVRVRLPKGGGLFFPDAIKRYATGSAWEHEKDGARTPWDYMLAIRGVLLLRGAARSPRGSRRSYPAFPFVFGGHAVRAQGKLVEINEVFLPTWGEARPRSLAELSVQIRQFQARAGQQDFAATAADFRRAIRSRAVSGGFAAFHRFALEPRKPGERQPQVQAVARGVTRVGSVSDAATSLRLLLAPIDDAGWLDRFRYDTRNRRTEALTLARSTLDVAVHAALDDPTADRHADVLAALWRLQYRLWEIAGDKHFRAAPLLSARAWHALLAPLLDSSSEARIAWAIASIGWVRLKDGDEADRLRPLVEQLLPVRYEATARALRVPDPAPPARIAWRGQPPARDFAALLWRRWLDTVDATCFPLGGTRSASLDDVVAAFRGQADVARIHDLVTAFLVLDGSGPSAAPQATTCPVPPAYAILRLWIELGIRLLPGSRRPMDGDVVRGIVAGGAAHVGRASVRAAQRLRVMGLPGSWPDHQRPAGRAVARPAPRVSPEDAARLALAVLVPIGTHAVGQLARCLHVPALNTDHGPKWR